MANGSVVEQSDKIGLDTKSASLMSLSGCNVYSGSMVIILVMTEPTRGPKAD